MTNEEKVKAREIADKHKQQCYYAVWGDLDNSFEECYESTLEAMEWKDKQFEEEKKEIDEQWKRLMAENKSIGVDLLQCKDEEHAKEKQQWIDKACEWLKNSTYGYLIDKYGDTELDREALADDFVNFIIGE